MSVTEIETAITRLTSDDLAELMRWLEDYHAKLWDKQIEGIWTLVVSTPFLLKLTENMRLG